MTFLLWTPLLLVGVAALNWGADRASSLVEEARPRLGLSATTAGLFVGLMTALPEISVSITSAVLRWPDLGLGTALGSNVPAIPLAMVAAFVSLALAPPGAPSEGVPVKAQTVEVQVVPYLLIVILLALLTLPPWTRGLQPEDALILFAAFGVVAWRAWRQPREAPQRSGSQGTNWRALLGLPALAVGAIMAVVAARRLTDAAGVPDIVGGLFGVGLLCALPEVFAVWWLARRGEVTMAVATAATDGIVSLTLGLIPTALVGADLDEVAIYLLNLAYLATVLGLYLVLNRGRKGLPIDRVRAGLFGASYLVYLGITALLLLGAFGTR